MNTQNLVSTWMRIIVVCMVVVLLGVSLPAEHASAASNCQCVTYVVNRLFGGPLSGNWPTAASMATSDYWTKDDVKPKRYNAGTAKAGDVIIMQPHATVKVLNVTTKKFETIPTPIGGGAGHIAFVEWAKYRSDLGGWHLVIRGTNWPSAWGVKGADQAGCSNVLVSEIFVPNGPAVSFWRVK